MKRYRAFLESKPWYWRWTYHAVAFAGLSFLFANDHSLPWSIFAGVFFATFMTAFDEWRLERRQRRA
jgi:hypothetical protein